MKKKNLTSLFLLLVLSIFLVACGKDDGKMSNQEKAEKFAKELQPKMEERIRAEDYNKFVESIHFNQAEIDPLGGVVVDGYINNNSNYGFTFFLNYNDPNDVSSYGFGDDLSIKMGNFDKDKPAPLSSEKKTSQSPSSDFKTILSKYKLNL
ncbi:DUF1433 domain-containing protein [Listeria welshimeri]|nr:DUF1433 domain-containing protein [Listeria welshimeri]